MNKISLGFWSFLRGSLGLGCGRRGNVARCARNCCARNWLLAFLFSLSVSWFYVLIHSFHTMFFEKNRHSIAWLGTDRNPIFNAVNVDLEIFFRSYRMVAAKFFNKFPFDGRGVFLDKDAETWLSSFTCSAESDFKQDFFFTVIKRASF